MLCPYPQSWEPRGSSELVSVVLPITLFWDGPVLINFMVRLTSLNTALPAVWFEHELHVYMAPCRHWDVCL